MFALALRRGHLVVGAGLTFERVLDITDLPVDTGTRIDFHGTPVAVFNAGGSYYAVQDTCTHDDASLADGEIDDTIVECPLHGAKFDLETGKVKALPAVIPVKVYPVQVRGDGIYLSLPE